MYILFHTFAYLKSSVTALLRENWDHGHRTNLQSTAFIRWIWWRWWRLLKFIFNKSFIYIFYNEIFKQTVAFQAVETLSGEKHNQKTNSPCTDSVLDSQELQIYNRAVNVSSCQMEKKQNKIRISL